MIRTLVIIPARGGSKGVLRKNVRLVDGLPLIAYAIKTVKQSRLTTSYYIDTEDIEIANIARGLGSPVLIRPTELASDETPIVDVVIRIVELLNSKGDFYDTIVLLQPTSPLRTGRNLDEIIEIISNNPQTDAVVSVVASHDVHPARMYHLIGNNEMLPLKPELEHRRRQDLEAVYLRNGCFYAIRTNSLLQEKTFLPKRKMGYVMPLEWLANIDDERDLIIAEALLKEWKAGRI